jgi:hypothetical protein
VNVSLVLRVALRWINPARVLSSQRWVGVASPRSGHTLSDVWFRNVVREVQNSRLDGERKGREGGRRREGGGTERDGKEGKRKGKKGMEEGGEEEERQQGRRSYSVACFTAGRASEHSSS